MIENGIQKLGSIGMAVYEAYPNISDKQIWVFVIMLKLLLDDNNIDCNGQMENKMKMTIDLAREELLKHTVYIDIASKRLKEIWNNLCNDGADEEMSDEFCSLCDSLADWIEKAKQF